MEKTEQNGVEVMAKTVVIKSQEEGAYFLQGMMVLEADVGEVFAAVKEDSTKYPLYVRMEYRNDGVPPTLTIRGGKPSGKVLKTYQILAAIAESQKSAVVQFIKEFGQKEKKLRRNMLTACFFGIVLILADIIVTVLA